MAIVLVIAGGILGFASAITALAAFDASLLQALMIWVGGGFVSLALALAAALLPGGQSERRHEIA